MAQTNISEMEGYRAMLLKSMPAKERPEGLDPEDRLLGLNRDQLALAWIIHEGHEAVKTRRRAASRLPGGATIGV